MTRLATSSRLAIGFFAHFSIVGLTIPFWPLWLAHRGMSFEQVGVLLALTPWARFASNLAIGQFGHLLQHPRGLLRVLGVLLLLAHLWFAGVDGFAAIFALSLLVGLLYAPLSPLLDGLTLSAASRGEASYGLTRLWGTLGFIATSLIGGQWLLAHSDAWILWGLVACCGAAVASSWVLPESPAALRSLPKLRGGSLGLLQQPEIRLVLLGSSLLHGSHAVYYAFGSQTWRAAGIGDAWIGWLWAEGAAFEVLLFLAGDRLCRRFGPAALLAMSGAAGIVRWTLLATTSSMGALLFGQALHAATFACMHLGAMALFRERVSPDRMSAATTLYGAIVSGFAMALAFPLAGWSYGLWGGGAYAVMAVISACGLLCALGLAARLRGGAAQASTATCTERTLSPAA